MRFINPTGEFTSPPGFAILWDGRDDQGRQVEPGLYVARLEASSTQGPPRRASVAIAVAAPAGAAR